MFAKVSKNGRITIPKQIRQILDIENGSSVFFMVEKNEVKLAGIPQTDSSQLAGSLKRYAKEYVSLKEIRRNI